MSTATDTLVWCSGKKTYTSETTISIRLILVLSTSVMRFLSTQESICGHDDHSQTRVCSLEYFSNIYRFQVSFVKKIALHASSLIPMSVFQRLESGSPQSVASLR